MRVRDLTSIIRGHQGHEADNDAVITLIDIGDQLGITQERVRQIEQKAIRRIWRCQLLRSNRVRLFCEICGANFWFSYHLEKKEWFCESCHNNRKGDSL